jgi:hypothetical protein
MQLSILVLHIVGTVRRRLGIDMAITELVIDRSLWGEGFLLRSEDNTMCCLGFASLACGVPIKYIEDVGLPEYSWTDVNLWMRLASRLHNGSDDHVVDVNDSYSLTGPEKEEKLIKIFNDNGVKLSFIGEYRPGLLHGNC